MAVSRSVLLPVVRCYNCSCIALRETAEMIKEKKTETELVALLMARVRDRPECEHVIRVAIIRPKTQNWDAAWTVEGNEIPCQRAFAVARELQAEFDLA